jgi:hypothetical protein
VQAGERQLLDVVHALDAPRGLAGRLDRRQEQRHENADDGDHDEQLDEREGAMHSSH